jgi:predicted CXXCH cytochrome family protein
MTEELAGREKHGPFKIGMCNGCHKPHQSQNPKLMIGKSPELCFTCHSTEDFTGKIVHKPLSEGRCYDCHGVHTSPNKGLLKLGANELCQKCHANIARDKHPSTPLPPGATVRSSKGGPKSGHPMDQVDDPKRLGKTMACISCHNPHSSNWKGLFRYKAEKPGDLCLHCHR